jgi:DNA helicase-2/ATP-dependent DNA helicase PcrA
MTAADDNAVDDPVDEKIYGYVDLDQPKSFLLFAGAGSGKTRSLVNVLDRILEAKSRRLWLRRQKVRVITYTNAACDEINKRLRFHPLVEVSTIHSFCWSLISNFNTDIREWLRTNLEKELAELEDSARRGRPGTKAAADREISIASKQRRLARLDEIRVFTYSANGDNRGREALNHSEVIAITASFLTPESALAQILVHQYPVLLIDESQDTNRHLMEALLAVQAKHRESFCLGLFGDMMQRIYADGKVGLAEALPDDWERPAKVMNHRCPPRVVELINKVREAADGQQQRPRSDKPAGTVRLFVLPNETIDKAAAEAIIALRMSEVTGDQRWIETPVDYKTLTLEHHMAARRAGFLNLYEPLYAVDRLRTGLLDGTLPGIRLFANDVLPLVLSHRANDDFAKAAVVRQRSPLLKTSALKAAGDGQPELLSRARTAVERLLSLWSGPGANPTFLEVLLSIAETQLFEMPEPLRNIAAREQQPADSARSADPIASAEDEVDDPQDEITKAWDEFLKAPFEEIIAYVEYVSGTARSATHQGVKGLEFPRVMVVMDDQEARGFLFSYDKFFGAKAKSGADLKNEREGAETTIDRTRRLFYVTCSRAMESLAVVAYSADPNAVLKTALEQGWFTDGEVELVGV